MAYGMALKNANHRDGGVYYSGKGDYPLMSQLTKDFPVEFDRQRQVRSWCLDPGQLGSAEDTTQEIGIGQGLRVGSVDLLDIDELLTGVTKAGHFLLDACQRCWPHRL